MALTIRKSLLLNILLCFMVLFCNTAKAQNISVNSAVGQNIDTFINRYLVAGGVHVYNVKFNGSPGNITKAQIGTFQSNGFVQLFMDSGVVMTTGNISVAPGPNNSGSASASVASYASDNMLNNIASASLYGCAWLDFDFVSVSPFITVNYSFGSDEYPEYVCSSYNDVFAFYISGPDPSHNGQNRQWNMASIPHTTSTSNPDGIAVAINTVNPGQSGSSGGSGSSGCNYNFSQYYVSNTWNTGVQYDGFTRKLSASATIIPCEEYHMHIGICNVGDNSYDSGVFIESHSFNSPVAQINFSNGQGDTIVHSHPVVIPLSVDGSDYSFGRAKLHFEGEGVCGVDYLCISSNGDTLSPDHPMVNISAPGHSLTFVGAPGRVISDTLNIEVILEISLCEQHPELTNNDTLRFVLVEDDIVALRDTIIRCADTCREVGVEVAYARHPLTWRWDPDTDIDFPHQQYSTATISESRTYHVVATDDMGNYGTATVEVIIGDEDVDNVEVAKPRIYPNPTDGWLNIEAEGLLKVELWNHAGVCIYSATANGSNHKIDTSPFAAGTYTLVVETMNGRTSQNISVVK